MYYTVTICMLGSINIPALYSLFQLCLSMQARERVDVSRLVYTCLPSRSVERTTTQPAAPNAGAAI